MHRHHPRSPRLLVPLFLSLCCGCSSVSGPTPLNQDTPKTANYSRPEHRAATGALVSVSEANGQVLVELPVGSGAGVEPGAFFRLYDANEPTHLKGMVQVTEVIAAQRSIARQVGLSDRTQPLKVGDHALEVPDLAALASGGDIESAARKAQKEQAIADNENDSRYASVRDHYQRELAQAKAQFSEQLTSVQQQYQAQLQASDLAHQRELERRQLELRADVAALKSTLSEHVAIGISDERKRSEERIIALNTERANLQNQVDNLLKQQADFNARIAALVKELSDKDRSHQQELRAEVETREILQARLGELEARGGEASRVSSFTVLSADPGHSETVLDRLTRVSNELASERAVTSALRKSLDESKTTLNSAHDSNAVLAEKLAALAAADDKAKILDDELASTRQQLATSQDARTTHELARLDAERQLYDLAARVLRLAGSSPETVALQARLKDVLNETHTDSTPTLHAAPEAP